MKSTVFSGVQTHLVVKVEVCGGRSGQGRRREGERDREGLSLSQSDYQVWGSFVSSPAGSSQFGAFYLSQNQSGERKNSICLFNLFIDKYSDTNKPTVLRIS